MSADGASSGGVAAGKGPGAAVYLLGALPLGALGVLLVSSREVAKGPPPPPPPAHVRKIVTGAPSSPAPVLRARPLARRVVEPDRAPARSVVDRVPSPPAASAEEPDWGDLHDRWKRETRDHDGTENVVSYVSSLMWGADAGANAVEHADCGRTVCRVVFGSTDVMALARAQAMAGEDRQRWSQALEGDGGVSKLVVYLPRRPGSDGF